MAQSLRWWQEGVIYQIVTPSFLDTNQDGMGDLAGITARLDYLNWLGVRAIWLTPFYPTPFVDLGYDVSDFTDVDQCFGSLDDFDELVRQAHERDLKIILDWVPNHTSSEHPWFGESASARDHPRRDWYIWRDGKEDGSPPNNWISVFGGSVWEWHEPTRQFYMHTFHPTQPDLNWSHPDVQNAMLDTLRFWLERGVDGFRVDALDLLVKDEQFRDNPPNPDFEDGAGPDSQLRPDHTRDQPGVHEAVARMREVVEEFGHDRLLAGELYLTLEQVLRYYGEERPELHLPLNLNFAWTEWNAETLGTFIEDYDRQVPADGWPSWTLSTHDRLRLAARCEGEQTRVGAMLLLTLRGTPTLYYGEEIGMKGTPIPPEDSTDPQGRRTGRNRDPERTPMQWSGEKHAGFSDAEPWLPVADDFTTANVAAQSEQPGSLLTLYRRLISLRREQPALIRGSVEMISRAHPLLAYRRVDDGGSLTIVLNLSNEPRSFDVEERDRGRILLSVFLDREGEEVHDRLELRGSEGILLASGG